MHAFFFMTSALEPGDGFVDPCDDLGFLDFPAEGFALSGM